MRFNTDSDLSDHEKDSFSKGNNIIITTPKTLGQKIKEKRQLLTIKQLAFIVLEAGLRKLHSISSYYFHIKLIINVLYK